MVVPPIPWLGHLIEIAALGLFAWVWIEAFRHRRGLHIELLIAVSYGWVLETLDMLFFGTYHYGAVTWFWVGDVPLYIPLLWATILHSSMAMADQTGLPEWARPFLDGLLAVLIDLAVDAIAIRLGLWKWGIAINEGWFGVPAGNLCAWMFVAAWYGAITRWMRSRLQKGISPSWHRLFVPVIAYVGLVLSLFLIGTLGRGLGLHTQNQRLWLFLAQFIVFVWVVRRAWPRREPSSRGGVVLPSLKANRWLMHGSFFLLLICTSLVREVPALLAISLVSMVIEGLTHRWCGAYPQEV